MAVTTVVWVLAALGQLCTEGAQAVTVCSCVV